MQAITIHIVNKSTNPLPEYATEGSAGMDLRADLPHPVTLQSLDRLLIPTGLFIQLPDGYEAQVRPRSGMAIKHGITCLNSPGTVDSDYRGEIKVILANLGKEPQIINNGDRIAQMVIAKVEKAVLTKVEELNSTKRGDGGFGHSGKI